MFFLGALYAKIMTIEQKKITFKTKSFRNKMLNLMKLTNP